MLSSQVMIDIPWMNISIAYYRETVVSSPKIYSTVTDLSGRACSNHEGRITFKITFVEVSQRKKTILIDGDISGLFKLLLYNTATSIDSCNFLKFFIFHSTRAKALNHLFDFIHFAIFQYS